MADQAPIEPLAKLIDRLAWSGSEWYFVDPRRISSPQNEDQIFAGVIGEFVRVGSVTPDPDSAGVICGVDADSNVEIDQCCGSVLWISVVDQCCGISGREQTGRPCFISWRGRWEDIVYRGRIGIRVSPRRMAEGSRNRLMDGTGGHHQHVYSMHFLRVARSETGQVERNTGQVERNTGQVERNTGQVERNGTVMVKSEGIS